MPLHSLALPCRLLRQGAQVPTHQTADSAGMDLCACPEDGAPITLGPLMRALIGTGIAVAIPKGFEGQIRPRSGWALKHGITVLNSPGTIDADYRGEIKVLLINLGQDPVVIKPGDRIAQLLISSYASMRPEVVATLEETQRGSGGYGHTGGMA